MSSAGKYRFEHVLEHYGDGDLDVWVVLSDGRGQSDPVAKCYSRDDAALIVKRMNAGSAPGAIE
jgi:hypothetical protein